MAGHHDRPLGASQHPGLRQGLQPHHLPAGRRDAVRRLQQHPGAVRQRRGASGAGEVVDRQQFIDAFNAPWGAKATCGYGLSNTSWYSEESSETCPAAFDVNAATAELKAAGYDGAPLEFTSLSDVPDLSLPADLLIPQLQGAGAKVERNALELARYSQTIFQGRPSQFGITVMSDPAPITQFACSDQSKMGWTTYCSPEMTKLMSQADAATSVEQYEALMAQASDVLKKDAVIVPLLAKSGVGLLNPDLKGWQEPQIMVDIQFANLSW